MVSSSLELPAPKSEDSGPEETTLTLGVVVGEEEFAVKRVTGGVDNPPREAGDAVSRSSSCLRTAGLEDFSSPPCSICRSALDLTSWEKDFGSTTFMREHTACHLRRSENAFV